MRNVVVAATQMNCSWDKPANIETATRLVRQADDYSETVILASFDLDEIRRYRADWGGLCDRQPDLYGPLIQRSPERN